MVSLDNLLPVSSAPVRPLPDDIVGSILVGLRAHWDQLPQSLWDGLYHVAAVHGFCERSLRDTLEPAQAAEIDACFHAAMLVTPLWNHINQCFSEGIGCIFQHLCGCGCHLTIGSVSQDPRAIQDKEAIISAFFSHRQRQIEAYADQFVS